MINRLVQKYVLLTYFTNRLKCIFLGFRRYLVHQMAWSAENFLLVREFVSYLLSASSFFFLVHKILNVHFGTNKVVFHFDDAFGSLARHCSPFTHACFLTSLRLSHWFLLLRLDLRLFEILIKRWIHSCPAARIQFLLLQSILPAWFSFWKFWFNRESSPFLNLLEKWGSNEWSLSIDLTLEFVFLSICFIFLSICFVRQFICFGLLQKLLNSLIFIKNIWIFLSYKFIFVCLLNFQCSDLSQSGIWLVIQFALLQLLCNLSHWHLTSGDLVP
jgi:hypothetical protein